MTRAAQVHGDVEAKIRSWAALQYNEDEVAVALGLSPAETRRLKQPGRAWNKAFLRGRLEAEAAVRKSILERAIAGDQKSAKAYQGLVDEGPTDLAEKTTRSEARRKAAVARLRELEVAEAEGRLMDYELGRRAWFELCREVRDRILLVPDRVAPLVLAATDLEDARRIVDEDLRAALSSLPERPPRGERGEDRHGE